VVGWSLLSISLPSSARELIPSLANTLLQDGFDRMRREVQPLCH
jgi:hypothetical protein